MHMFLTVKNTPNTTINIINNKIYSKFIYKKYMNNERVKKIRMKNTTISITYTRIIKKLKTCVFILHILKRLYISYLKWPI